MSDSNDIVTELRNRHANVTGIDPRITTPILGPTVFSQAADEIERLREQLDEAKSASLEGQNAVVNQINALCETLRIVNDKMAELRSERDEARREVCNMKDFHGLPRDYALERGWNCFKEDADV